jgi:hypothetical protein
MWSYLDFAAMARLNDECGPIVLQFAVRLRGAVIMHMSKYKIFKMIDYLARDRAKSAQLDIDDDDVIQRQQAQLILATDETAPQPETRSRNGYYSVIARAVSRLPNNTREARQALYDRAGVALAVQLLDEKDLPVSDAQLANERLALERAIRKVERAARKQEQPAVREQPQEKHRRSFSSFLSFFRVSKP